LDFETVSLSDLDWVLNGIDGLDLDMKKPNYPFIFTNHPFCHN